MAPNTDPINRELPQTALVILDDSGRSSRVGVKSSCAWCKVILCQMSGKCLCVRSFWVRCQVVLDQETGCPGSGVG
jgi:hypothetical protein